MLAAARITKAKSASRMPNDFRLLAIRPLCRFFMIVRLTNPHNVEFVTCQRPAALAFAIGLTP